MRNEGGTLPGMHQIGIGDKLDCAVWNQRDIVVRYLEAGRVGKFVREQAVVGFCYGEGLKD